MKLNCQISQGVWEGLIYTQISLFQSRFLFVSLFPPLFLNSLGILRATDTVSHSQYFLGKKKDAMLPVQFHFHFCPSWKETEHGLMARGTEQTQWEMWFVNFHQEILSGKIFCQLSKWFLKLLSVPFYGSISEPQLRISIFRRGYLRKLYWEQSSRWKYAEINVNMKLSLLSLSLRKLCTYAN